MVRCGGPQAVDQRPADDGAAHGAPAAIGLVDLRRRVRLVAQRALGLDLRIRDVAHRDPVRLEPRRAAGEQAQDGVTHLRHRTEVLELVAVVRGVEAEEVGRQHRRLLALRHGDLGRPLVVGRQLRRVRLEELLRLGEVLGLDRAGDLVVRLAEGLALQPLLTVEPDDRADDDVADLARLADAAGGCRW